MVLKRKASCINKLKKEVRFNNVVNVGLYKKASPRNAKHIWYRKTDMSAFKAECRRIVSLNQELCTNNQQQQQQPSCLSLYRGLECYSLRRKKQKIIANRCVLNAQKVGMMATDIAIMYRNTNYWSSDVAFIQGIQDYVDVYPVASCMIPSPPSPSPPFLFAVEHVKFFSFFL